MKYVVKKTSEWCDAKPCDEAYEDDCFRVDSRNCSEAAFDLKDLGRGKLWIEKGVNHRKTEFGIARDFADKTWFVDVDDLMAFSEKYGEIIVDCTSGYRDYPYLEIYDDYRE